MTQFDFLADKRRLKKEVESLLDAIAKKCKDCEEIAEFAGYEIDCSICSLGQYRKNDVSSVEESILETYAKTVKIKNPKPISL